MRVSVLPALLVSAAVLLLAATPALAGGEGMRFEDVAAPAGVTFRHQPWRFSREPYYQPNQYTLGTGVLVADVDGNGFMDLYFLQQDGPNRLFLGRPDGTFGERAAGAGVAVDDRSCSGGAFGDYDNDGRPDLYVTTIRQGNLLFHNEGVDSAGRLRFRDVTSAAGVGLVAHSTTACWVDLDNDGRLDLYVGALASWTREPFDSLRGFWPGEARGMHSTHFLPQPDVVYRNRGDGTFEDATAAVGLVTEVFEAFPGLPEQLSIPRLDPSIVLNEEEHASAFTTDVTVTDYDDDGWPDLYVSNMWGLDILYHNEQDGTLRPATREAMSATCYGSHGARWADLDNNGWLDLYVVDMNSDMWWSRERPVEVREFGLRYNSMAGPFLSNYDSEQARRLHGGQTEPLSPRPGHPYLYGNTCHLNAGGYLEEAAQILGLENWWPWGVAAADFDLDGWIDLFVPAGMGWPFRYSPCFLHRNLGGRRFEELAAGSGLEPRPGGNERTLADGSPYARSSRAAAVLDFDNDGDADIAVVNWDDAASLWNNRGKDRPWVGFQLQGQGANRDAVGAKVFLRRNGRTQVQIVSSAGGYLAQSDPRLVFGLGGEAAVESVEIVWPGGRRQAVREFGLDRYNLVVEEP